MIVIILHTIAVVNLNIQISEY